MPGRLGTFKIRVETDDSAGAYDRIKNRDPRQRMNRFASTSTSSIYTTDRELKLWIRNCAVIIHQLKPEGHKGPLSQQDIESIVEKAVQFFNIECLNFPDERRVLYGELVGQMVAKFKITDGQVRSIFADAKTKANIGTTGALGAFTLTVRKQRDTSIVKIGVFEFRLPTVIYDRMVKSVEGDEQEIMRLFLRYYPLGPLTGYFWSMDKRLYTMVDKTDMPVLECFASPFNFNLNNFCAPYPEDIKFGARGDFFTYIKSLNVKCRLIANPPYTSRVMNETAKLTLDYVERVPGGEVVMMYPYWADHDSVLHLQSKPNCQWKVFNGGEYVIHDFSKNIAIAPPMPLIFFVLHTEGHVPTITVDDLAAEMKNIMASTNTKAKLTKKNAPTATGDLDLGGDLGLEEANLEGGGIQLGDLNVNGGGLQLGPLVDLQLGNPNGNRGGLELGLI